MTLVVLYYAKAGINDSIETRFNGASPQVFLDESLDLVLFRILSGRDIRENSERWLSRGLTGEDKRND